MRFSPFWGTGRRYSIFMMLTDNIEKAAVLISPEFFGGE